MRLAVLAATCLLALAACGGSDDQAAAPPDAPTESAAPATAAEPATDGTGAATAPSEAECTEETFPEQGRDHVDELPAGFSYNSFPATSGPHNAPVVWNAYTEPLPELYVVHNLEHGGIVAQFGSEVPAEHAQALAQWYIDDPVGLVIAPLPELGDRIALTAWTHLLTCDGFDEEAATAFRDAYRFNGPELIPAQNLQPGM